MVKLLRRVHAGVGGSDSDFLYVLLSLLVVPARWVQAHGWRPLSTAELAAAHRFYFELGTRMGLKQIPESYDEAARFFDEYEASTVAPSAAGTALTQSAMASFTRRLPKPLRRFDRALLSALLDDERVVGALDLPATGRPLRTLVRAALCIRQWRTRRSPLPTAPGFVPGAPTSAYPDGYLLSDIGPR